MPRWPAMVVSALCVVGKVGFLPFAGVLRTPQAALFLEGSGYGSTAKNNVSLVNDDGLTCGDSALRRVEGNLHAAIGLTRKRCRLVCLTIPVLCADADVAGVQCGIHPPRRGTPNPIVRQQSADRQVLELS